MSDIDQLERTAERLYDVHQDAVGYAIDVAWESLTDEERAPFLAMATEVRLMLAEALAEPLDTAKERLGRGLGGQ